MSWEEHQGAVRGAIEAYEEVAAALNNVLGALQAARVRTLSAIGESDRESALNMLHMCSRVQENIQESHRFMANARHEAERYMNGF